MIKYKNISCFPLTFYGVTFNPNDEKEVSGYINHPKMVLVKETPKAKPKAVVEIAKAKPEVKTETVEVKPKRQYNRKKNTNQ